VRLLHITTVGELVDAIVRLAVRGAPVLGAAGALGVALAVRQAEREGWDAQRLDTEVVTYRRGHSSWQQHARPRALGKQTLTSLWLPSRTAR
jgi:methylthioribose-1-phosphate isomerase